MKYLLVALLTVVCLSVALEAKACQNCKIDMYGCLQCRESDYDGYQSCVVFNNGNSYQGQNGYCEGPLGTEECAGNPRPCPHEKWVMSLPESRQLQLTNVTIIRPDSRSTTGS